MLNLNEINKQFNQINRIIDTTQNIIEHNSIYVV